MASVPINIRYILHIEPVSLIHCRNFDALLTDVYCNLGARFQIINTKTFVEAHTSHISLDTLENMKHDKRCIKDIFGAIY